MERGPQAGSRALFHAPSRIEAMLLRLLGLGLRLLCQSGLLHVVLPRPPLRLRRRNRPRRAAPLLPPHRVASAHFLDLDGSAMPARHVDNLLLAADWFGEPSVHRLGGLAVRASGHLGAHDQRALDNVLAAAGAVGLALGPGHLDNLREHLHRLLRHLVTGGLQRARHARSVSPALCSGSSRGCGARRICRCRRRRTCCELRRPR